MWPARHIGNLTAQFNDIGVMLAAGQSPLQLAVQQGTQINQVFQQLGSGANAMKALRAGFLAMISPLSLLTLGIIAGGAALVQWGIKAALRLAAKPAHLLIVTRRLARQHSFSEYEYRHR